MKVDMDTAARLVRQLQDALPRGAVVVALIFEEGGETACLCERPIPHAFELVQAWVLGRVDAMNEALDNTPQA